MMLSMVMTTCENKNEAKKISKMLLESKLAACVKLSKIKSSYWWHGKITNSSENLLTVITTKKNSSKIIAKIKRLHSYEVPEIVEIPINRADKNYLRWVLDVTK